MMIFVRHIDIEGPGMMADFLSQVVPGHRIIAADRGETFPEDLAGVEGIVILGGPMNVYEEERYPFLKAEDAFIRRALDAHIPLVGMCLGAQLIAKATGARVTKALVKEIGFSTVELTAAGKKDPLFEGIQSLLPVFQWHEDTFDVPAGAELLAHGTQCPNQAFRVGSCAYGLQFHVEVTHDMITQWMKRYWQLDDIEKNDEAREMIEECQRQKHALHYICRRICENFAGIKRAACGR